MVKVSEVKYDYSSTHELKSRGDCDCDKMSGRCPVCDWGLGVCKHCDAAEIQLADQPCTAGMKSFWVVSDGKSLGDFYISKENAKSAIMSYLSDEYWLSEMLPQRKATLAKMMAGDFTFDEILDYYNSHCGERKGWFLSERSFMDGPKC